MAALDGIRIVDLSRILAGPWATQILADLGAEVIKIERLGSGDDTRYWGPPWMPEEVADEDKTAAYFHSANRNKKSIAVNIADSKGQELIKDLIKHSDILIENFKVGNLKRYHLDYDSVKTLNPKLIYCSITGFGQTGPYAKKAGYDLMIQALGGLMSITGNPEGEPMKVGVALIDVITGLYASNAIQAALLAREKTGVGQSIDLSLLECELAVLSNQGMNYLATGIAPSRRGNTHPSIVPYQAFACADGSMVITVGNDGQFARFATALGKPEWIEDERFKTNPARVTNRKILTPKIAAILASDSTAYWIKKCTQAGLSCAPVNDLKQAFADPQVKARKAVVQVKDYKGESFDSIANPMHFSGTPIDRFDAPPSLGQHTHQILTEILKMPQEKIKTLRKAGVISSGKFED